MYIFKLKLSEKARGYCMYVFLVFKTEVPRGKPLKQRREHL